ncbi:MAG: glycoside hydrolase family 127 protein [Planctomycetaceae bacterium]|nr:glycoside hydrolase family 127 protein [Planctomycetaceae bacterium]
MRVCTLVMLIVSSIASVTLSAASTSPEALQVRVVQQPAVDAGKAGSEFNRAPLTPVPLTRFPVGSITPRGWLRQQLKLQAQGMHGRLAEVSKFLKWEGNGWVNPQDKGGWEEVPYWIKGYGDLGYVLHDETIITEARRWIDAILASQQPDGWFGPIAKRTGLDGKPDPDMWPHMPVLNALQSYYEFSNDPRVLTFMLNYSRWQNKLPPKTFGAGYWPRMRFGDNLETVYWLYNRTGEPWLLELAKKIHENMADWTSGIPDPHWHNVNFAECFREPAEYWMQARDQRFFHAPERNYQLMMGLYGQFPGGGFAGDEVCRKGYDDPRQGFETCGIVEFIHSFQMLARISGNPLWADRCEQIAFNSLPAAMTPDLKALRYLTAANQAQSDHTNKAPGIANEGAMLPYSPHKFRCCQHNHGMGWPYYAEELWLRTADGGVCASLYAASELWAKLGSGKSAGNVRIVEETDYPFGDTITLTLDTAKPLRFPLYLRMPGWVQKATLTLNDQPLAVDAKPLSYVVIDRTWTEGDRLTLQLPMHVDVKKWAKNKDSVSVAYGPLEFSLKIGERWSRFGGTDAWPEWDVYPTTPWNYGLVLNQQEPAASFEVARKAGPLAPQPFTPEDAPIELRAKARQIPAWKLDRNGLTEVLPQSPVKSGEPEQSVTLIPMGAARLRISAFPTIMAEPKAASSPR